jgi:4-hydroxybenzoate polyprenyltransferase
VLFFPIWTVLLSGIVHPQNTLPWQFLQNWKTMQTNLAYPGFCWGFISVTMLMASVFIINQFTDTQSDRANNKLFILADGLVSQRAATFEILMLLILALIFALLSSATFIVLSVMLFLVTGVGYSLPPFLWKDRPILGLSVNLVGGLLTFLIGWQIVSELSSAAFGSAIPYLFAVGAVYFLTTIPDRAGDALVGKLTFAVKFGERITIRAALLFEVACIIAALYLRDYLILIPALGVLPFFIRLLFRNDISRIILAARLAILLLSISVVIHFPAYAILMLAVFLLSKWYYQKRFQLNYPGLSPVSERIYDQNQR